MATRLALLDARHSLAHGFHHAGGLVADAGGEDRLLVVDALAQHDLGPVEADRLDPDADLAGAGIDLGRLVEGAAPRGHRSREIARFAPWSAPLPYSARTFAPGLPLKRTAKPSTNPPRRFGRRALSKSDLSAALRALPADLDPAAAVWPYCRHSAAGEKEPSPCRPFRPPWKSPGTSSAWTLANPRRAARSSARTTWATC